MSPETGTEKMELFVLAIGPHLTHESLKWNNASMYTFGELLAALTQRDRNHKESLVPKGLKVGVPPWEPDSGFPHFGILHFVKRLASWP